MEKRLRLKQLLRLLAFSLIVLISFPSCNGDYREDYSFENEIGESIIINLYSDSKELAHVIEKDIELLPLKRVLIHSIVSDGKRDAAGANYLSSLIDSVYITNMNNEELLIIWRNTGSHFIADGYEANKDFFSPYSGAWTNHINHGKNHEEYIYFLVSN